MTDSNIKVVVEPEAKEEAYRMGYNRFSNSDLESSQDFQLSHYTESANWAHNIAPRLRCMAGARDPMGKGTWTEHSDIVTVEFPEDRPMNGTQTDSYYLFDELVNMFRYGACDAIDGKESDVTRWD